MTCAGNRLDIIAIRVVQDQANPSPTVLRLIAEELHSPRRIRAVIAKITDTETEASHDQPPG
ncbi:hypothetical protein ACH4Y0_34565 [Streptomyces sp. NPDC020707]|uniref:hypothetical protein n=1 Tax=Streptomyces sp. NPDC020707 TaxID=3365084 RepID=UPI003790F1E3